MQTHVYKTSHDLNAALAEWIANLINDSLKTQGRFTFCLSGGNTPKALYEILASDYHEKVDWQKVHFFWGDERYVPFEDEQNNAGMAYKNLLSKINVKQSHIHIMRTDLPVDASVKQYENILHEYFDQQEKSFDLVLLGMGEDGHTLSLFPGAEIPADKNVWVKETMKDGGMRISLTPSIVNRAAAIAFVVTGETKAPTLQSVLQGPYMPNIFPSQLIKPANGNLHYFLDEAAAKDI